MVNYDNLMVMSHPLIQHKITILRDKNTGSKQFRELIEEIAILTAYEATRDLPLCNKEVETPICKTLSKTIDGKKLTIVPILRAGLGMVNGILSLLPSAKVGHIGLFRNEETLEPVKYYFKVPQHIEDREVILLDPMLATGGSAVAAVDFLKESGAKEIKFMCIIAAPEGIKTLCEAHPDIKVYCGVVDEKLNEHGYIVPGLGDAGDRIFGTK
ncbi:MAG: uracil phosphoribosyltransferase [Clostridia bacterium]|nr:uracil phosphoribosyltransferase [Clostridia bacterium]